jgi:hypothetical protein
MDVRLEGIDAPEHGQPFADESKEHLIGLVSGKDVDLECSGLDEYSRLVCKILLPMVKMPTWIRLRLAWPGTTSSFKGDSRPLTEPRMVPLRMRLDGRISFCGLTQPQSSRRTLGIGLRARCASTITITVSRAAKGTMVR